MIKIPEEEIRKRMQKLNNYERILYPQLKERSDKLRTKNRELQEENERLRKENKQIEKLQLELEELRIMKFGKKRENPKQLATSVPSKGQEKVKPKKKRPAESYRRREPDPEDITDELRMELEQCPECEGELIDRKEHIHYREDLYEIENLIKSAQKIVKTIVESGKCKACGTRQHAMEIPKQKVIIGQQIRNMVVYLTVVQGQSYKEVLRGLKHQYGINLSDGELANILEGESVLLTPYYNKIVEDLEAEERDQGAHYDETTWKTQSKGKEVSEGNYCWVKIGVESQNRLIWFGRSRGKRVAEVLRGDKKGSKGVSDDYGSYKNLFDHHQLCWAHPNRKLRDLSESEKITGKTKKECKKAYKDFADVYKKSRKFREKLKSGILTKQQMQKNKRKLLKLFEELFEPTDNDPEKLTAIRKSLKERKERYFTFINHPSLPLDNNKAERAMRKIVIKRKKSFGCQSQKGADVLSVLYSVVFSFMESYSDENFFSLYNKAIIFEESQ